jgi:hypothetical protein
MPIAADLHAAPAALMRFRLIRKPQDAGLIFTPFYKTEIACCKQVGSCLWHRRQY